MNKMEIEDVSDHRRNLGNGRRTTQIKEKMSFPLLITIKSLQVCGLLIHESTNRNKCKISVPLLLWSIFVRLCVIGLAITYGKSMYREIVGLQSTVLFVCFTMTMIIIIILQIYFTAHWKDHFHLLDQMNRISSELKRCHSEGGNGSWKVLIIYFYLAIAMVIYYISRIYFETPAGMLFDLCSGVLMNITWVLPAVLFYQCCQTAATFIKSFHVINCQDNPNASKTLQLTANLLAIGLNLIEVCTNY